MLYDLLTLREPLFRHKKQHTSLKLAKKRAETQNESMCKSCVFWGATLRCNKNVLISLHTTFSLTTPAATFQLSRGK